MKTSIKKILFSLALACSVFSAPLLADTTAATQEKGEAASCESVTIERCTPYGCRWVTEWQCAPDCHPEQVCEQVQRCNPYGCFYVSQCHFERVCN